MNASVRRRMRMCRAISFSLFQGKKMKKSWNLCIFCGSLSCLRRRPCSNICFIGGKMSVKRNSVLTFEKMRVISHSVCEAIPQQVFTQISQRCLSLCGHVLKQSYPGKNRPPWPQMKKRKSQGWSQGWSQGERSLSPISLLKTERIPLSDAVYVH